MAYDVRTEHADPRPLAAVRATTTQPELSTDIPKTVDIGVEAFTEFTGDSEVQLASTPAGEVATTAFFGDYAEMAPAYAALEQWCTANWRRPTGVSWEVYGDWDDDPVKRRTDLFILLEPATA